MSVIIQCPHCQAKLRVSEKGRGTKIRCPACQAVFRIAAKPAAKPTENPGESSFISGVEVADPKAPEVETRSELSAPSDTADDSLPPLLQEEAPRPTRIESLGSSGSSPMVVPPADGTDIPLADAPLPPRRRRSRSLSIGPLRIDSLRLAQTLLILLLLVGGVVALLTVIARLTQGGAG